MTTPPTHVTVDIRGLNLTWLIAYTNRPPKTGAMSQAVHRLATAIKETR